MRTFTLAAVLLLTPLTAALAVVNPNNSNCLTVVNDDHAKRPVSLVSSPVHPLITIEGQAVTDLSLFTNTIPLWISPCSAPRPAPTTSATLRRCSMSSTYRLLNRRKISNVLALMVG